MMHAIRRGLAAIVLLAALGGDLQAAPPVGYLGLGLGSAEVDEGGYEDARSWKLVTGILTTENLGVELAYVNLGRFDVEGVPSTHVDVDGLAFSLLGRLPVSDGLALFGKLGLYSWTVEAVVLGGSPGEDDGLDPAFGLGAEYAFAGAPLGLRLEREWFRDISGADIGALTASLLFYF